MIVIDGNKRYHFLLTNGRVVYSGNNPLRFYWLKTRFFFKRVSSLKVVYK